MDLGKRLLAAATLAGFAIAAPLVPAQADKLDDVINAGKLRCAVVLDFPPIGFYDENNDPAGFDVEYCKDLAKALEVDHELLPVTWAERLPAIVANRADVVFGGTSDSLQRAKTGQASVWMVPRASVPQETAIDQVIGSMRSMRGLRPRDESNFAIIRSDQLLEIFNTFIGVFFLVMLALSSVGLLVGGIGVIGIMMISVTERTREIGIRKAVGATRQEIMWQFLVESAVLTFLGGVAGLALGAGLAEAVAAYTPIPASIPLWAIFAAMGMAIVTGILFGIAPAYRASRLDPISALRHE